MRKAGNGDLSTEGSRLRDLENSSTSSPPSASSPPSISSSPTTSFPPSISSPPSPSFPPSASSITSTPSTPRPGPLLVALAGNPNSGKSTLFNRLTGARQTVANYPGVTVEKRFGSASFAGRTLEIVDLPGTYSLSADSLDEQVARDFIVQSRPDAVIAVLDASNLERHLYLTVQLLELGAPLIVALNMSDVAERRGVHIDAERLGAALDCAAIPTVASRGRGVEKLLRAAVEAADERREWAPADLSYGEPVDTQLSRLARLFEARPFGGASAPARWVALKCLEQDPRLLESARRDGRAGHDALRIVSESVAHVRQEGRFAAPAQQIAEARYERIARICGEAVRRDDEERPTWTDAIDRVATHPLAGPLMMMAVLYAAYWFTFGLSKSQLLRWIGIPGSPIDWMEALFAALGSAAARAIPAGPLQSLVVHGVIGGVGGVLSFVPIICFMFFAIAILEDSGYMARAAFLLDRVMRRFGLHGQSVIAMVVSGGLAGGCAVPGVMATRTLREPRERLATILVCPFMNCGAKLPVYAMLIAAFFSGRETAMMLLLTAISWAMALGGAWLLRKSIVRGPRAPFLMELPPYRMPTLRSLLTQTIHRVTMYIRKAGTVILAAAILLWALMTFPRLPGDQAGAAGDSGTQAEAALAHSAAGRLGKGLGYVLSPLGMDWRTSIALVGGFAAKEVVVSTLSTAYSLGVAKDENTGALSHRLAADPSWSPLKAFVLLLFVMMYAPCVSTIAVVIQETRSWKWGLFSMSFSTGVAWLVGFAVYQVGRMLGIGI